MALKGQADVAKDKTDAVPNPTMMIPNTTFYNSAQAEYAQNRTGK